jgi:hypothetical protein
MVSGHALLAANDAARGYSSGLITSPDSSFG